MADSANDQPSTPSTPTTPTTQTLNNAQEKIDSRSSQYKPPAKGSVLSRIKAFEAMSSSSPGASSTSTTPSISSARSSVSSRPSTSTTPNIMSTATTTTTSTASTSAATATFTSTVAPSDTTKLPSLISKGHDEEPKVAITAAASSDTPSESDKIDKEPSSNTITESNNSGKSKLSANVDRTQSVSPSTTTIPTTTTNITTTDANLADQNQQFIYVASTDIAAAPDAAPSPDQSSNAASAAADQEETADKTSSYQRKAANAAKRLSVNTTCLDPPPTIIPPASTNTSKTVTPATATPKQQQQQQNHLLQPSSTDSSVPSSKPAAVSPGAAHVALKIVAKTSPNVHVVPESIQIHKFNSPMASPQSSLARGQSSSAIQPQTVVASSANTNAEHSTAGGQSRLETLLNQLKDDPPPHPSSPTNATDGFNPPRSSSRMGTHGIVSPTLATLAAANRVGGGSGGSPITAPSPGTTPTTPQLPLPFNLPAEVPAVPNTPPTSVAQMEQPVTTQPSSSASNSTTTTTTTAATTTPPVTTTTTTTTKPPSHTDSTPTPPSTPPQSTSTSTLIKRPSFSRKKSWTSLTHLPLPPTLQSIGSATIYMTPCQRKRDNPIAGAFVGKWKKCVLVLVQSGILWLFDQDAQAKPETTTAKDGIDLMKSGGDGGGDEDRTTVSVKVEGQFGLEIVVGLRGLGKTKRVTWNLQFDNEQDLLGWCQVLKKYNTVGSAAAGNNNRQNGQSSSLTQPQSQTSLVDSGKNSTSFDANSYSSSSSTVISSVIANAQVEQATVETAAQPSTTKAAEPATLATNTVQSSSPAISAPTVQPAAITMTQQQQEQRSASGTPNDSKSAQHLSLLMAEAQAQVIFSEKEVKRLSALANQPQPQSQQDEPTNEVDELTSTFSADMFGGFAGISTSILEREAQLVQQLQPDVKLQVPVAPPKPTPVHVTTDDLLDQMKEQLLAAQAQQEQLKMHMRGVAMDRAKSVPTRTLSMRGDSENLQAQQQMNGQAASMFYQHQQQQQQQQQQGIPIQPEFVQPQIGRSPQLPAQQLQMGPYPHQSPQLAAQQMQMGPYPHQSPKLATQQLQIGPYPHQSPQLAAQQMQIGPYPHQSPQIAPQQLNRQSTTTHRPAFNSIQEMMAELANANPSIQMGNGGNNSRKSSLEHANPLFVNGHHRKSSVDQMNMNAGAVYNGPRKTSVDLMNNPGNAQGLQPAMNFGGAPNAVGLYGLPNPMMQRQQTAAALGFGVPGSNSSVSSNSPRMESGVLVNQQQPYSSGGYVRNSSSPTFHQHQQLQMQQQPMFQQPQQQQAPPMSVTGYMPRQMPPSVPMPGGGGQNMHRIQSFQSFDSQMSGGSNHSMMSSGIVSMAPSLPLGYGVGSNVGRANSPSMVPVPTGYASSVSSGFDNTGGMMPMAGQDMNARFSTISNSMQLQQHVMALYDQQQQQLQMLQQQQQQQQQMGIPMYDQQQQLPPQPRSRPGSGGNTGNSVVNTNRYSGVNHATIMPPRQNVTPVFQQQQQIQHVIAPASPPQPNQGVLALNSSNNNNNNNNTRLGDMGSTDMYTMMAPRKKVPTTKSVTMGRSTTWNSNLPSTGMGGRPTLTTTTDFQFNAQTTSMSMMQNTNNNNNNNQAYSAGVILDSSFLPTHMSQNQDMVSASPGSDGSSRGSMSQGRQKFRESMIAMGSNGMKN